MLIRYPLQWSIRKLISKFEKHLFNQKKKKNVFGMTFLHAHAQYIYIVNAKYQKVSVKSLIQVDFPIYAQAKSLFKSKQEKKMANFKKLLFCQKNFFLASNFFMPMFNESILRRQSIELFWHTLWCKLNSPHMHYLYTSYTIAMLDKQPFC